MNKGVIVYHLRKLGYGERTITSICKKINRDSDFVELGKKDENMLTILFYINGFLKSNVKNCWRILERDAQIAKLCYISQLLNHEHFKEQGLINYYVNRLNNGACLRSELVAFLKQNGITLRSNNNTTQYISSKARKALEYISQLE